MSDYVLGQLDANLRRNAEARDLAGTAWAWKAKADQLERELAAARSDAAHWMNLAQQLTAKLTSAEMEVICKVAQATSLLEVGREMRRRISELAPEDPLGQTEHVNALLRERNREIVEEHGCRVVEQAAGRLVIAKA